MKLVVDASVSISLIVEDEDRTYAERMIDALASDRPQSVRLWQWDVANAFLALERRKRIADASATFSRLVATLSIELSDDMSGSDDIELARRYGLTAYDASYLTLAKRLNAPLATLDRKLERAARAEHLFFECDSTP